VSADLAARASLANRLPGMQWCAPASSAKYVLAHIHSSAAILQHQRAGFRKRTSCGITVIVIIIICIDNNILLCISSANKVLE
jgi:hypothetical protein